ncbi:hypothetical protein GE061_003990 [Apolygus lucorum]|uniref:DNA 3'-5' helicase n=1 Tax=Apolygus lucorum TaxID=248454 RepID=A0A8S9WZQ0_APOLU|nr:hypothetical protein GE061_003990 [Apolygus lucorum]
MDTKTKLKYEKAKYTVKKWEKEFRSLTSTTPAKADIKNAPSKIRDAYRTYWKLKTSVLESTLSDILIDENAKDCFNSSNETTDSSFTKPADVTISEDSVCFQPLCETTLTQSFSTESQSHSQLLDSFGVESPNCSIQSESHSEPLNFKNVIHQDGQLGDKTKPEIVGKENVDKNSRVWGEHLNNDKVPPPPPPSQRKLETKSLSMQYAQKLFNPSKFKNFNKKNPRKPRVFQKAKTSDSLPLVEKPKFDIPKFEFFSSQEGCPEPVLVQSSSSFPPPEPSFPKVEEFSIKDDASFTLLNDKLKIVSKVNSSTSNAVSLLQKTFNDDHSKSASFTREVDSAWLNRIQQSGDPRKTESMSQDSGLELSQGLSASQPDSGSDSDDLIYDSDSESQTASRSGLPLTKFSSSQLGSTSFNSNSLSCSLPLTNSKKSQSPESTQLDYSTMKSKIVGVPSTSATITTSEQSRCAPTQKQPFCSKSSNEAKELDSGVGSKRQLNHVELPPAKKIKTDLEEIIPTGTLPEIAAMSKKRAVTRKKPTQIHPDDDKKRALLEKKLQSGKANENFVSINIQKKVFVRGKKTGTFSKYKKQKWRQLKQENGTYNGPRGVLKCFKCGDVGHFSKACPSDKGLLPLEDYVSDDESAFPTLEQAAEAAKEAGETVHSKRKFTRAVVSSQQIEPAPVALEVDSIGLLGSTILPPYSLNEDGSVKDTPKEVFDCLRREFGHEEFLEGQELAMMRILSGKSTLVTLSTGSGKSLCYQLPAAIYSAYNPGCITLVISPLVSLMDDQVDGAGGWEKSACYHTYMTQKKRDKILEQLKARELSVLLLSPETLVSLEAGAGKQLLSVLPPIAFACVDEAHCLHQWCHNFRPSYLTVTQVLRERFGVQTLLGLTATASSGTIDSLMGHLGIDPKDKESLIKDTPLPDNLTLSVSVTHNDVEKQDALIGLLTTGCFADCSSIIIYCTRRETCDKVAGFLRTSLQIENGNNKKGRLSLHAEVYHAGLTGGRRNQVQKSFMTGKLRIVVATVAFGMGINKPDIRGVIHYSLPSTFENYVQEVGRAGRDRQLARCHLFLDSRNEDLGELRRHIYCDTIDRFVIRKLLQLVFIRCNCDPGGDCPKHEVAFPIDTTVATLDLPQQNVSTLLAYLELNERKWIKTLPLAYTKCKVSSYRGPNHLKSVCKSCPPLALVFADHQGNSKKSVTSLEFDIFELSRKINWDSGVLKKTLKNLEWTTENDKPAKSGMMVEFMSLGFRVLAPGNLPDEELDHALDVLNNCVQDHEKSKLKGLQAFYGALSNVSYSKIADCEDGEEMSRRSERLKDEIRRYFNDQTSVDAIQIKPVEVTNESSVTDDIRQLIVSSRGDHVLTGRTIARILHGIGSPNFPPLTWARTRFWRLHMNQDFNALCRLATQQLLLFRNHSFYLQYS